MNEISVTDVRDQVSETSVTDVRDREPVDQTSVIDVRDQIDRVVIELTDESFGRVDGHVDHGWLDDTTIDAAHVILKSQFPLLEGFQPCVYAATPCFKPVVDNFIQIVNTHPQSGGQHWVMLVQNARAWTPFQMHKMSKMVPSQMSKFKPYSPTNQKVQNNQMHGL